jgi:hypothetical protein
MACLMALQWLAWLMVLQSLIVVDSRWIRYIRKFSMASMKNGIHYYILGRVPTKRLIEHCGIKE